MTKQRKIKRGQIFLNLYSGWQNMFVVLGSNNAYYYGVEVARIKGEYRVYNVKYYLATLRNDSERFPLIGEMSAKDMWVEKVLECITYKGAEFIDNNYDENGHKLVRSEVEK